MNSVKILYAVRSANTAIAELLVQHVDTVSLLQRLWTAVENGLHFNNASDYRTNRQYRTM